MRRAIPLFALLALAGGAAPASAQEAQPARASAYPLPGTRTASPGTDIAFRGRTRAQIGRVRVVGSRSGLHRGRLRAHSDGRGASFVPRRPFRRGERVTVRTSLPIVRARNGDFRFRIGRIVNRPTIPKGFLETVQPGARHRFRSRPDLRPPKVAVSPGQKPTAPGLVFLSPKSKIDKAQAGPMIIDNRGQPVFFKVLPGITAATDVRAQTYRGRPVLTYWEGTSRQGIGVGDLVILDSSYREIRRLRAPNGFRPDLHEFLITPDDTALIISYPAIRRDLRPVGGSRRGVVIDSVIQEIDIATGLVVFEWHSIGPIKLRETFSRPQPSPSVPFDYAHANSATLALDGDVLMSARNTWAVYKIDRASGRIRWRLGGKRSSFRLGPGVRFAWQHDAQQRADGAITLFDNSAFPPVRKRSRALAIRLDRATRSATLESAFVHPNGLLAATQGNQQHLPHGGSLVGWGSQRYFTEFDAAGGVLWDARVAIGFESYRAYRAPWVGAPRSRPAVAGVRSGDAMTVYASWNGATEVARWEVLAGGADGALAPVANAPRSGFETAIPVAARTTFVAVRALAADGSVLGTSPARRVR